MKTYLKDMSSFSLFEKILTMWFVFCIIKINHMVNFVGGGKMKQNEKSTLSMEKIISGAIKEFGSNCFDNASINSICSENEISKGLIYHYFKNKDELYLICLKRCLDAMNESIFPDLEGVGFEQYMSGYFEQRTRFFKENEYFRNIFFSAILQPPKHLVNQIQEVQQEFTQRSKDYFCKALDSVVLRENITRNDAIEYFCMFQEMFNVYFQGHSELNDNLNLLVEKHEIQVEKILNIILYGIAKEGEKE